MAERRQAHRREPIEMEVRGEVLEARPLPFTDRNDLGNEIMSQYAGLLNDQMKSYADPDGTPRLELFLNDKISDPVGILKLAYPHVDESFLQKLEPDEVFDLIYASLEVNLLTDLRELVDPNALAPTMPGGNESSGMESPASDTQSPQPSPDSSSQESGEKKSSRSRTRKSSTSSANKTENSGTSDGGS